jgi:hypothetical protein
VVTCLFTKKHNLIYLLIYIYIKCPLEQSVEEQGVEEQSVEEQSVEEQSVEEQSVEEQSVEN